MTMPVAGTRAPSPRREDDEPSRQPAASPPVPRGADGHIDATLAHAVRHTPHGVLYVGMNRASRAAEAAALGPTVSSVHGHAAAMLATPFGRFDLLRDDEAERFAHALATHHGLGADRGDAIARALVAIHAPDADARDEIARIALAWAAAESGNARACPRIVLSAHSTGTEMWGDESGTFSLEGLRALAKAMPRAAADVEHIHFAACFTAAQVRQLDEWRDAFPNLRSLFGYEGYSPTAPVGHLRAWERATRSGSPPTPQGTIAWTKELTDPRTDIATRSPPTPPRTIAWNEGLIDSRIDIATRRAAARDADARFDGYVRGEIVVRDPHDRIVESDYAAYRVLASVSPTAAERAEADRRASVLLRVRFYETSLRAAFARSYGAPIAHAYRALGLDEPDFARLGRMHALARIDAFRRAAPSAPDASVREASRLLDALASLDASALPAAWCH